MGRSAFVAAHFLCAFAAVAVAEQPDILPLSSFEPGEPQAVVVNDRDGRRISYSDEFATEGVRSLRVQAGGWKKGEAEWPWFNFNPSIRDWRGYDRLVIDLVNAAPGGDGLSVSVKGAFSARTVLPAFDVTRWVVPLNWGTKEKASDVSALTFGMERPVGLDLYIDNVFLVRGGAAVPVLSAEDASEIRVRLASIAAKAPYRTHADAARAASLERFTADCRAAGTIRGAFVLGTASSMESVRPRDAFSARPAEKLKLRLARGETEAVQLVVTAAGESLKGVKVSAGNLRPLKRRGGTVAGSGIFSATNITCSAVGYVLTTNLPPYRLGFTERDAAGALCRNTSNPRMGWWPNLIMPKMSSGTDVAAGDVQSFWISVTCPRDAAPGVYVGYLEVAAEGTKSEKVPFAVRVNAFEIPRHSPLPLAVTFAPEIAFSGGGDAEEKLLKSHVNAPSTPINLWRTKKGEWVEFLAAHYLNIDSLYNYDYHPQPDWESLLKAKAMGLKPRFNLGYFDPLEGEDVASEAKWREKFLPRIRRCYELAKEYGLVDGAYIYGCDEIPRERHGAVAKALSILKREFPAVPIGTTCYDKAYGEGNALGAFDVFTPLTREYDLVQAEKARAAGRKVAWYISCEPHPPYANMFIESQPIEARLIQGAMSAKMKPDGFLFYQTTIWNATRGVSADTTFTTWNARSWTTYNGDGAWTACAADGSPVSTIRLENFRDGLDDLWYFRLAAERGVEVPIPETLVKDMKTFSDDPSQLYAWRDALADAIERAK